MIKAVPWNLLQKVLFDDFFGKKLSYEGFTIEKVGGGYHVSSDPAETVKIQTAAPESILQEKLLLLREIGIKNEKHAVPKILIVPSNRGGII